jgi:hypothetical protein
MLPLPYVDPAAVRSLLRGLWRKVDEWTLESMNTTPFRR